MHWSGQVDDTDERWEMDVEKVVRQVGLGILRQYRVWFRSFSFLIPHRSLPLFLADLQSDPISEDSDEFMT